jgi:hypothetical protein
MKKLLFFKIKINIELSKNLLNINKNLMAVKSLSIFNMFMIASVYIFE